MKIIKEHYGILLSGLAVVVLVVASGGAFLVLYKKQTISNQQNYNNEINSLQNQISALQSELSSSTKQSASAVLGLQQTQNRQQSVAASQKSQEDLVTSSVSKATPAVVSIIISEDLPQYKVVYENPFGDDPLFQNSGLQIPVYEPTGQSQQQEVGAGSGFIVNSNGYILTNNHVVSDDSASYTVLLSSGKQLTAHVVYKDPNSDIAIIKIDGTNYPTINLGDSDSLKQGDTVIAIGNALGQYNNSVSVGVVSGLNRDIQASSPDGTDETLNGVIQVDAAINPGNSGGPLLDLNGDVMGINVATVQGSNNIGFSIPINDAKAIINKVI